MQASHVNLAYSVVAGAVFGIIAIRVSSNYNFIHRQAEEEKSDMVVKSSDDAISESSRPKEEASPKIDNNLLNSLETGKSGAVVALARSAPKHLVLYFLEILTTDSKMISGSISSNDFL
jgi:hypothetical protein